MLILKRKPDQRIILTCGSDRIEIVVVNVRGDIVRIGVQAGKEWNIARDELERKEPDCERAK